MGRHVHASVASLNGAMTSFDEACRLIHAQAGALQSELVPIGRAANRVLATDVVARRASPVHAVSAMDGYAVREADLAHLPAILPIAGQSFAGKGFGAPLPQGACVRIFTGAPLPAGADRVVIQEDVRQKDAVAHFVLPLSPRRHLRAAGSDFAKGAILLRAGTKLRPQSLVAAAAADQAEVAVWRRPRVAILCCGDELAAPGACGSNPDRIPESISYGVTAMVEEWGGEVVARWHKGDDVESLQRAVKEASTMADVIVSIGGASVGDKDFAKQSFTTLGFELSFQKVAIKPGKPVWFGGRGSVLVLGLPGNPTSAMVTARLFLAPLLAGMSGRGCKAAWDWRAMHTGHALEAGDSRETFLRASTTSDVLVPVGDQDSASQNALALATHLIRRRAGAPPIAAGAILEALAL